MITFKDTTAIGITTKLIGRTDTKHYRIKASTVNKNPITGKKCTFIQEYAWKDAHDVDTPLNHADVAKVLHYSLCKRSKENVFVYCDHFAYRQYVKDGEYIFLFGSDDDEVMR